MPQISVIVPVYKVEPYLRRCVDSILSQTFTDFELILVDDGSPDNCGAICDEYAATDPRVHVIHQPNGGLSAARNAGIDWAFANSDSEWLAFVDSDDWVHPQYLELLYKAVRETGVKISMCECQVVHNSKAIPPVFHTTELLDWETMLIEHSWHAIVAWNKLYAKELFQAYRYPIGKIYEDEFLTHKLLFHAQIIAYFSDELYYYFHNKDGIMNQAFNLKHLDALEALEEKIAFSRHYGSKKLREYDLLHFLNFCENTSYTIHSNGKESEIMYSEVDQCLRKEARRLLVSYYFPFLFDKEKRHLYFYAFPNLMKAAKRIKHLIKKQ